MVENNDKEVQTAVVTTLAIPELANNSAGEFRVKLAEHINQLITKRFDHLISILYRMDVSENHLRQLLIDHPGDDSGLIIADMIIARESEKIKTRRQYGRRDENISEEDKW